MGVGGGVGGLRVAGFLFRGALNMVVCVFVGSGVGVVAVAGRGLRG